MPAGCCVSLDVLPDEPLDVPPVEPLGVPPDVPPVLPPDEPPDCFVPTCTVTDAVVVPPLPFTVNVYVVVWVGWMVVVPWAGTEPTPGSRSRVVPFCDDQLNMDDCPELIEVGWAIRLEVGARLI